MSEPPFVLGPTTGGDANETTRTTAPRGHARMSLNLTAMIDVVFLLMIYFMVATEFKVAEEVYRLDLPDRLRAARELDPFDLDEKPLKIEVASMGAARSACRLRIDGPYPQPGTFEELHEFLRARQIRPENAAGLFRRDHPIIIVPSVDTRWEHAVETLNAAARARYTNVMFGRSG